MAYTVTASPTAATAEVIPDGLYRVAGRDFVAGFVVRSGQVVQCAPILRRNLTRWMRLAIRISP